MTKNLMKGYVVVVVLALIFLSFIMFRFTTNVYQEKEEQSVGEFKDLEIIKQTEDTVVLHGTLPERDLGNECLGFLSSHEEVRVYAAGGLAYALNRGPNVFGGTTGQVWNFINLRTRYALQPVTIQIRSVYGRTPEVPTIYIGSKPSLLMMIVGKHIVPYCICILALLLGIVMLVYWCYIHHQTYIKPDMLYLGIFSILLGIWSVNEVSIHVLVLQNHVIISYIAYITLMLLPVPFVMFVRSLYQDEKDWAWNIALFLALVNTVVSIVFQVFRIQDMNQMLKYSHVVLGITGLVLIYYSVRAIRRGNLDRRIKINIVCIFLDIAGLTADVLNYYFMSREFDSNMFGRLAFFTHIVLLGWSASKESTALMKKGREAAIYEKLAYRDQLTELFNRTAFEEDLERLWEEKDTTLIIMMDLNDLKKCNDTLGHDAGDRYIKNAARMIDTVFHDKGKCYRIGGDEFCSVMKTEESDVEQRFFDELRQLEQEYNEASSIEQIAIAYGYARFDKEKDATLMDTRNRADVMMYEHKKRMKAGEAS